MWTVVVAALAFANGVVGLTVNMAVPPTPAAGTRVELTAPYTLTGREHVKEMTWTKDGEVFMKYEDKDGKGSIQTTPIQGMNMNVDLSEPQRIVLDNVSDAASGQYGLSMTVVTRASNSMSTNHFQKTLNMLVGGADSSDGLDSRFGGQRPAAAAPETTFIGMSAATSSGGRPAVQAAPAGQRPELTSTSLQQIADRLANAQAQIQAAVANVAANLGI